ncbi:MAG: hypothetical protein JW755_13635 [Candidatus Aminicenantes bacterium]|nr:hypothetical protein [Candidatus Aminicenantes bacterium]
MGGFLWTDPTLFLPEKSLLFCCGKSQLFLLAKKVLRGLGTPNERLAIGDWRFKN